MGEIVPPEPPGRKPKLLDAVGEVLRANDSSKRTEGAEVAWIKRFILFRGKRHPKEMGGTEVGRFLSSLAVKARAGPSEGRVKGAKASPGYVWHKTTSAPNWA